MNKRILLIPILMVLLQLSGVAISAETSSSFMPTSPLFKPLLADPREAHTALTRFLNRPQWEGAIGRPIEFVQWGQDLTRMGWGITGSAFCWLDQHGTSFPMRSNDWWFGTYVSRKRGFLSQKFEYTHISTHLGDALSGERNRIIYSREMLRLLISVQKQSGRRSYIGIGALVKSIPYEKPLFLQTGIERSFELGRGLGQLLAFYCGLDIKYKQETGGTVNTAVQFGIRLHAPNVDDHGVRFGFSYLTGKSEFGQFYREEDTHWTFGIYFD